MHNALLIAEVLGCIVDCLAEDGTVWDPTPFPAKDTRKARRALAVLARTCRAFSKPALDALWCRLHSLEPYVCLSKLRMTILQQWMVHWYGTRFLVRRSQCLTAESASIQRRRVENYVTLRPSRPRINARTSRPLSRYYSPCRFAPRCYCPTSGNSIGFLRVTQT